MSESTYPNSDVISVDVTEQPDPPFVVLNGDTIVSENFPQFSPADFHKRCNHLTVTGNYCPGRIKWCITQHRFIKFA